MKENLPESTNEIFITSPFMTRLANKGLRDHIINADPPDIERFMHELCDQVPDNDLLTHLRDQEIKFTEVAKTSTTTH